MSISTAEFEGDRTGTVTFEVPDARKECKTWYKIFGDLKSGKRPLVVLHGGPGATHFYLLSVADLATKYSIPVVFYDQLGCGHSTRLPEKKGDKKFWTPELFLAELDNLIQHLGIGEDYDVLGQSWGGILAALHAVGGPSGPPSGLKRVIIADSLTNMATWVVEARKLRNAAKDIPDDVKEKLTRLEDEDKTDSEEYQKAMESIMDVFYGLHVCRIKPFPEQVQQTFKAIEEDPTVYHVMNGPSEFHITGTLKNYDITSKVHKISIPTLLINGQYDEATDACMKPYFDLVPKVKWVTIPDASHMPQWEQRERFMEIASGFLKME